MSRRRKFPQRWATQVWEIQLYKRMWWFGRLTFTIKATTSNVAIRKFQEKYPKAHILSTSVVDTDN